MLSAQSIVGGKHDFTNKGWNNTGELCATCHAPHNASSGAIALWDRQLSTATYTLYSGSDIQATLGQPDGASMLCLSCHDGTVSMDNFGGVTNATGNELTGGKNLGTNLSDDHPISFVYADVANNDPEINAATSAMAGLTIADFLENGKMQCSTCHDVHGTNNAKLLHVNNAGSALCMTCHGK